MASTSATDKVAAHWVPTGDAVRCGLCPHRCRIAEGKAGICGVRENRGGTLVAATYGKVASIAVDPIEKKPLYHFHPGSRILSLGTFGCNFRCDFCQNWQISQEAPPPEGRDQRPGRRRRPAAVHRPRLHLQRAGHLVRVRPRNGTQGRPGRPEERPRHQRLLRAGAAGRTPPVHPRPEHRHQEQFPRSTGESAEEP